jgi:hypothetical protein
MTNLEWDGLADPDFNDDIGQPKLLWEGSAVEVRARVVPRYFWTTASIDVFLDGRCILRTGGQMKAVGSSKEEFLHRGDAHTAELSWEQARMANGLCVTFPYRLYFDGAKIAVSDVRVDNPASAFMPFVIFASIVILPFVLPVVATFF